MVRPIIYSKIDNLSHYTSVIIGTTASNIKQIIKEGPHDGEAYDKKNTIQKPIVRFDTDKGEFYRVPLSTGTPTLDEVAPLLNATADVVTTVIPANSLNSFKSKSSQKAYDYVEKQVRNQMIKKTVKALDIDKKDSKPTKKH
jgi:hypothetical protein